MTESDRLITRGATAYECPLCKVVATQDWFYLSSWSKGDVELQMKNRPAVSQCRHCGRVLFWIDESVTYPRIHTAPAANPDLPETVALVYEEAASVFDVSPRSSCALLRLATEELLRGLGFKGDLDKMIGALVKQGVPPRVQQAMDVLRVHGNELVHTGEINLDDTRERALVLFNLLNWIADDLISRPAAVDAAFGALPETKREHIERRDG